MAEIWPLGAEGSGDYNRHDNNSLEKDCEKGGVAATTRATGTNDLSRGGFGSGNVFHRMGVSGRQKMKMNKVDATFATNILANERTLLAWIRTCLAITSLGGVLSRVIEKSAAIYIGAIFVIGSGLMACMGAYLYTKRNNDLVHDRRIRISNALFMLVSAFILVISICVLILLFW